nr:hypothetical protein [Tanacetum cinerariifolium]GEZ59830.1 hypothetical protein [Tanacetum cinerariifolium]GEZ60033.1 hypothetical protein [Tanacetum cinerariifolium]
MSFINELIQQKLQNEYAQPFSAIAITLDLPTMEPEDYLRMGDEHLNTISETESDEFIKSIVENLVPSPSESEDEHECDVPACDDFTTVSNLLFDADDDFSSSIKNDDYDSEVDMLILEEFLSNDSLSLPENESFDFDIPSSSRPPTKPPDDDLEILTVKVMGDISEHNVPIHRLLPTQPTLTSNQEKSPHLLSHQGFKAFHLSLESPMMIYRGNTPILDVPFLYFYPP